MGRRGSNKEGNGREEEKEGGRENVREKGEGGGILGRREKVGKGKEES